MLSHVWLFVTPWTAACQAPLSFTISRSLLKFMSVELVMPSNHLILCCLLLLLPSIFPSIRVFPVSQLHIKWSKNWSFSFSISPSSEYSELISFRIDWFDLLAVQETLKSLRQNHSLTASILWSWAFLIVLLSYAYMTTGKTIALTIVLCLQSNVSLCFLIWWVGLSSEKAMAPHSSTLSWKIPWIEEPGRLQSMGSLKVGHNWATSLSLFTFMHWRRKWQATPVFLPGESQGRGSLVGFRLWGRTGSDRTEAT